MNWCLGNFLLAHSLVCRAFHFRDERCLVNGNSLCFHHLLRLATKSYKGMPFLVLHFISLATLKQFMSIHPQCIYTTRCIICTKLRNCLVFMAKEVATGRECEKEIGSDAKWRKNERVYVCSISSPLNCYSPIASYI